MQLSFKLEIPCLCQIFLLLKTMGEIQFKSLDLKGCFSYYCYSPKFTLIFNSKRRRKKIPNILKIINGIKVDDGSGIGSNEKIFENSIENEFHSFHNTSKNGHVEIIECLFKNPDGDKESIGKLEK